MKSLREQDIPYLRGEQFSNAWFFPVAKKQSYLSYRVPFLQKLAQGKKVIHVGCVDHLEMIPMKEKAGLWLHKLLNESAKRCLGIDINEEGIDYLRRVRQFDEVYHADLLGDPLPEIVADHWDLMILGEILEHVDNPVAFLTPIHEKYRAHVDQIVFTVPNAFSMINF
jgi:2-polyprenyl-3-methyl-5-hydroxy-6-metoxy-1,4-benzoquinol methylase